VVRAGRIAVIPGDAVEAGRVSEHQRFETRTIVSRQWVIDQTPATAMIRYILGVMPVVLNRTSAPIATATPAGWRLPGT
jgi:hypothetical protein